MFRMAQTACIFCQIAHGEIPARFVHEDPEVVAFADINPQAPTHLVVIPRAHHANFSSTPPDLHGKVAAVAAKIAREAGLARGFRVVVNEGPDAAQSVPHLHYHVLGGRSLRWPPG